MPWTTFVEKFLRVDHDYKLGFRALRSHLEKCIGKEVT